MPKQKRQPGIHLHKTIAPNYESGKHEYYWILISKNGRTIAKSSETYKRKGSAVRSIKVAELIFLGHTQYYDHSNGSSEKVNY